MAIYSLASKFYPNYPDPMPTFQYLGGAYGRGLLESALAAPQQTMDGRFLHRTVFDKAAALFRSLVKNHPLVDGNKRLALTAVTVFLTLNGYVFYVPQNEAVAFTLRVASERDIPLAAISKWLRHYSVSVRSILAEPATVRGEWLQVVIRALPYPEMLATILKEIATSYDSR